MTGFANGDEHESESMYHSTKKINFEFGLGEHLDVSARIDDRTGELLAITNSDGTEKTGTCTIYDVYIDEYQLAETQELFDSWGISFSGHAWETEDQEDFPGHIEFSWDDLNRALNNKTVQFEKDTATGIWFIPQLFNLL